jgi:hypothetical protein
MRAIGRRAFAMSTLAFAAASIARARADAPITGAPIDAEVRDIRVPGAHSRRFTLLVPRHLEKHERVPLVVLLHGLGETIDERMGAFAWIERYGLGTAYDRLRRAPLARTTTRADWSDARVAELNRELALRPFRGVAIACPFTPDLVIGAPGVLDGFASWIADVVVPRARREVPTLEDAEHTSLGGCSLGGHFSLEVFLRRPEAFGGWGGVQTAISAAAAPRYVERMERAIARVGPRDLLVETSTGDPFRNANEELARVLTKSRIEHTFRLLPGPHDQPWLRESGSIEMLLWHDQRKRKRLRAQAPSHPRLIE